MEEAEEEVQGKARVEEEAKENLLQEERNLVRVVLVLQLVTENTFLKDLELDMVSHIAQQEIQTAENIWLLGPV